LLADVLKGVSRAFYLTLRVLPDGMREPVGLAYLLARAADTLADTRAVPASMRLDLLAQFRDLVAGNAAPQVLDGIRDAVQSGAPSNAERRLMESLPAAYGMFASLDGPDLRRVRQIVTELTEGMEFDLVTFPGDGAGGLTALPTLADLDRYTYKVAGCVGEFWTDTMIAHMPSVHHWDRDRMAALGVRFGKALQLTNVLRDVASDLRIGRCYLPLDVLGSHGLAPEDLLDCANAEAARPVLVGGILLALEHFESAFEYLLAIPRAELRSRLAVAWPLLIGLGTLEALAHQPQWLHPGFRSRVTRGWVYRMMARSVLLSPSDHAMTSWIQSMRGRVQAAL
jgi:farnesyl-diphosphate farnesyltransferase